MDFTVCGLLMCGSISLLLHFVTVNTIFLPFFFSCISVSLADPFESFRHSVIFFSLSFYIAFFCLFFSFFLSFVRILSLFNIGSIHCFSCINVCQVPREVLKTEAEGV